MFWTLFIHDVFYFLVDLAESTYRISQPLHFIIFGGILTIMLVFPFPGASIFVMILSFVANSFLLPAVYYLVARVLASTAHYFFVKKFFFEKTKKQYADNLIYRVVRAESENRPLLASIMVQAMPGPPFVKNMIISSSEATFGYFIFGVFVFAVPFGIMISLTGMSLRTVDQILNPTSFSKKSIFSKILTVVTFVLAILGFFFMIFIVRYAKKKVDQLEAELAEKQRRVTELVKILEEVKRTTEMKSLEENAVDEVQEVGLESGQEVEVNPLLEKFVIKEEAEEQLIPDDVSIGSF